jgi:hypothetical protein
MSRVKVGAVALVLVTAAGVLSPSVWRGPADGACARRTFILCNVWRCPSLPGPAVFGIGPTWTFGQHGVLSRQAAI